MSSTKTIETATKAAEEAAKAHDEAQAALRAARAAYEAQRTDDLWSAVEEAQRSVARRATDRDAADRALADAKAAEADRVRERERAADTAAHRKNLRVLEGGEAMIQRHALAIVEAERALGDALAAAGRDVAELAVVREQTIALGGKLGIEPPLPPAVTFARVRAAVSVAARPPVPFVVAEPAPRVAPHVLLPRAPANDRDCVAMLCELLGVSRYMDGDALEFPIAEQLAALLESPERYRELAKQASDARKAATLAEREAMAARREAQEREATEKDHVRRYGKPSAETART